MVRIFAAPFVTRNTGVLDGGAGLVVIEVLRVLAVKPVRPRAGTLHEYAGSSHVPKLPRAEAEKPPARAARCRGRLAEIELDAIRDNWLDSRDRGRRAATGAFSRWARVQRRARPSAR